MATAALTAGRMLWAKRDALFASVVAWAFLGVAIKRSGAAEEGSALVAAAAIAGLVVLGLGVVAVVAGAGAKPSA